MTEILAQIALVLLIAILAPIAVCTVGIVLYFMVTLVVDLVRGLLGLDDDE